jgi:hypothetical protein
MFPADTNMRSDPSIDKTILGKYLFVQCVTNCTNYDEFTVVAVRFDSLCLFICTAEDFRSLALSEKSELLFTNCIN